MRSCLPCINIGVRIDLTILVFRRTEWTHTRIHATRYGMLMWTDKSTPLQPPIHGSVAIAYLSEPIRNEGRLPQHTRV